MQREGIISALVPPERLAAFLATSPALVEGEMIDEMAQAFVCGSDQSVCGYMEGAVRTGRAAARAALGRN